MFNIYCPDLKDRGNEIINRKNLAVSSHWFVSVKQNKKIAQVRVPTHRNKTLKVRGDTNLSKEKIIP